VTGGSDQYPRDFWRSVRSREFTDSWTENCGASLSTAFKSSPLMIASRFWSRREGARGTVRENRFADHVHVESVHHTMAVHVARMIVQYTRGLSGDAPIEMMLTCPCARHECEGRSSWPGHS
jgi:hypothetical protein